MLEIPAQQKGDEVAEQTVEPEMKRAVGPEGRQILVVDDEETIVELLKAVLETSGHAVETAGNGREALEKIRTRDYDLVISDLKMPDMGGQKLYEEVKRHKPHMVDRMVFSTGDVVNPDTRAFFEQCGSHYLSKPFNLDEVEALVRKALMENER